MTFCKKSRLGTAEEIVNEFGELADGPLENYDRIKETGYYQIPAYGGRCRIKIEGADAYAKIELYRKDHYSSLDTYELFKERKADIPYNVESGTYKIKLSFNSVKTRVRLIFERKDE